MLAGRGEQNTNGRLQQPGETHTVHGRDGGLLALFVAWTAFAYRFAAPYFHNDHFEHLSMARQMLFGELPLRDFVDPGRPLTVALSALGQRLAPNLLSEAILTMGALAIGAALVFLLAARASRSRLLGLAAAAVVIAILPRLYSYPKILVFAVVLLAIWRYIDVPSLRRLAVLAAATVFAFLMRHDFGLYAGLAAGAAVFVTPRAFAWRRTIAFVALGVVLVSPYVAWLVAIGALGTTAASGAGKATDWLADGDVRRPALRLDLSHGIVHIDPVLARVHVRWAVGTDAAARRAREARFGLIEAIDEGGRTFAYGLTDGSSANLRALVNDERVEDTAGINRQTLTIDGPWLDRWSRRLPFSRVAWGPFFNADEAGVWLYCFVWAIPIAALVRLGFTRGRTREFSHQWRTIGSAALLGILLNLYLIRGSFDSRIPDVIVPAAVVGAWLVREHIDWLRRTRFLPARLALAALGGAIAVLFWASLTTYEPTASAGRLATAAFRIAPLRKAAAELRQRPIDFYAPGGANGVKRLTRYVNRCLEPDDRLLLVAYEPQVFYYSERLFAGGMEYFHQRRFSTDAELAQTVRRLSRQRVPLVIVDRSRTGMFEESYRPVVDYVRAHYHEAAATTFVDNRTWDVFAANLRPVRSTTDDGLPCYR